MHENNYTYVQSMNDRKVQYSIRHTTIHINIVYNIERKEISNVTSHEKDVIIQDNLRPLHLPTITAQQLSL